MQRCFRCLEGLTDRVSCCPTCSAPLLSPMQIGQILVEEGTVTQAQLDEALAFQRATGRRLGNILTEKGFLTERDFAESLARQLELPFFDLEGYVIDPAVVALVPEHLCERYRLIPLMKTQDRLLVAFADPQNADALADLKSSIQLTIKPAVATPDAINQALAEAFDLVAARNKLAHAVWGVKPRSRASVQIERRAYRRASTEAIAARSGTFQLRRIR
jgi:hypothetical protein